MVADHGAHALGEDLGAAAGAGVEPGRRQAPHHLLDRQLRALGEEVDLHHGERLEVHPGEARRERREQRLVVLDAELRVQAADDVQLGDVPGDVAGGDLDRFLHRVGPPPGAAVLLGERAQGAGGDADVGGVQVAVDVEERRVAVEPLADEVGEPPDAEQVRGGRDEHPLGERKAFAGDHLLGHPGKSPVEERTQPPRVHGRHSNTKPATCDRVHCAMLARREDHGRTRPRRPPRRRHGRRPAGGGRHASDVVSRLTPRAPASSMTLPGTVRSWEVSSAVEHLPYTQGVAGSNPTPPTTRRADLTQDAGW